MPADHSHIPSTIAQYAEAVGSAADAAGGLLEFLRSLGNPRTRARRLRRKAARLWRTASRVTGHGRADRAANLRARAVDAWAEAQRMDPLEVAAAIAADKGEA